MQQIYKPVYDIINYSETMPKAAERKYKHAFGIYNSLLSTSLFKSYRKQIVCETKYWVQKAVHKSNMNSDTEYLSSYTWVFFIYFFN